MKTIPALLLLSVLAGPASAEGVLAKFSAEAAAWLPAEAAPVVVLAANEESASDRYRRERAEREIRRARREGASVSSARSALRRGDYDGATRRARRARREAEQRRTP